MLAKLMIFTHWGGICYLVFEAFGGLKSNTNPALHCKVFSETILGWATFCHKIELNICAIKKNKKNLLLMNWLNFRSSGLHEGKKTVPKKFVTKLSLVWSKKFNLRQENKEWHASAYPKSFCNFKGLDVSKKAFSFLQPHLHEWMSEWMKSWLQVVMIKEEVKKGKPNNHQFTLITYTNIHLTSNCR